MKRRGDAYFVGSTAAVSVAQSRADGQGASRFLPHLLLDFLLSPGFRCLRWGKKKKKKAIQSVKSNEAAKSSIDGWGQ